MHIVMAMPDPHPDYSERSPRTIWTRGTSCADLARVIAGDDAVRATGDLDQACIEARAELLVTKKVPSKAIVASATPIDFAPDGAERVVALVSGGPNSLLAARVARWVGESLGVPASLIAGYRVPDERDGAASEVVERIGHHVPQLDARMVEAWTGKQLLDEIEDNALIVFGASGGSWIQRMFLGPGARLASGAQAGAIVVRDQPPAVFQRMEPPTYLSPLLSAPDALMVSMHSSVPVVALGALVGVVRRSVLEAAPATATVESVMEEARSVTPTDPFDDVTALHESIGLETVPVVNDDGFLVGVVHAQA